MTSEKTKQYIGSRLGNSIFIIGSPIISFIFCYFFCGRRATSNSFLFSNQTSTVFIIVALFISRVHIALTLLRTHLNFKIFHSHKFGLFAVPSIIVIAGFASATFLGYLIILTFFWDAWHSAMQTFGFSRIYDSKINSESQLIDSSSYGRYWDIGLSFIVVLIPRFLLLFSIPPNEIANALNMSFGLNKFWVDHLSPFFPLLKWLFFIISLLYVFGYSLFYISAKKNNYTISKNKILLLISTFIATLFSAQRFTLMDYDICHNIFHGIQYLYILFTSERENLGLELKKIFTTKVSSKIIGSLIFIGFAIPISIGLVVYTDMGPHLPLSTTFWILCALFHFYADGFIWSVRKKEVS